LKGKLKDDRLIGIDCRRKDFSGKNCAGSQRDVPSPISENNFKKTGGEGMKKIFALYVFLYTFVAVSVFAQENKVVVIPLGGKQAMVNGGFAGISLLTESTTYIMSDTDVSLPKDGTCVVTSTGHVASLDGGDTVSGPFYRTARQVAGGSPEYDSHIGDYVIYVAGSSNSAAVASTFAWSMAANTVYNFGCAFLARPANWSDDLGRCRVTWTCTEN
jgi:hypothetical protein